MSGVGAVGGVGAGTGAAGISPAGGSGAAGSGGASGGIDAAGNAGTSGHIKESGGGLNNDDVSKVGGSAGDISGNQHFSYVQNINMSTQDHMELRNTFHNSVNCDHNMDLQKLIEMMMALKLLQELSKES